MTLQLTIWTALGIFLGVGIVFIFGAMLGFHIAKLGFSMALEESIREGQLRLKPLPKGPYK